MNKHNAFKLSFVLLAIIVLSVIVWRLKEDPRTLQKQSSPAISSVFETVKNKLSGQEKIKQFASYEDLKNFMSANASNSYDGMVGGIVRSGLKTLDAVAPSSAVMEKGTASGSEIAPIANQADSQKTTDYSKTNVQVEGVDEADIIKTDGAYVYAVTQKDLFIIKAFPASQAETVAKIEFKSFPSDIYISGDRLVVFGYDDQILNQPFYRSFIRPNSFAFVKIFDISDKKNPKQVKDLSIEGNYTDSRLINDQLYFITNNYSYGGDPILPRIVDGGEVISSKCSGVEKCVMPPIYYFDIPYSSYSFTNITVLDIKNDQEKPSNYIYLLDGGQNLFVSQSNIYITYTKYLNEYDLEMEVTREVIFPLLNTSDKDKISKIEATDNFILSEAEKRQKVNSIIERFASSLAMEEQNKLQKTIEDKIEQKFKEKEKEMEKTMIYKIAINPKAEEKLVFKATGEVPGSVLNQFSMDENGAYFRIATTQHARWSRFAKEEKKSTNNLYVLDENLKTIGALEDVAEGEMIYSVRFMQSRAYLVTFVQTDPLFVIDLSIPSSPKILGSLKIPGFSNYLHPYDNNTLIGFGRDTEESEKGRVTTQGLKLSLFDVSDVSNPKELDNYIIGGMGSYSEALTDHKAFLFSKEKNLLVVPADITEKKNNTWGNLDFSGALVFEIKDGKFNLKGKISHYKDLKPQNNNDYYGYGYDYNSKVRRGLYISDNLYTFSNNYLKINKISDLEEIKSIELYPVGTGFKVITY